jgi:hypothetical protein
MRRFRFRLAEFLILIIVLGVGLAALREANDAWDSGVLSLDLGAMLASILLAIPRTGKRRAFWLGFALFGAAYLAMSLVPSIESRLLTTELSAYIDSKVSRSIASGPGYFENNDGPVDIDVVDSSQPNLQYLNRGDGTFEDLNVVAGLNPAGHQATGNGGLFLLGSAGPWLRALAGTTENFVRISHSLFALIVAFIGGRLSGYLYARNREPIQGSVNSVGPISNGSGG